ncbi:MAG: SLBB domain-containing protein [Anaerolineae bacterium]|nr:SLBB domain-containing protein [Gloeobacterales cyanobacterium ES-bin-313]
MKSFLLPITIGALLAAQSGVFAQTVNAPLKPAAQQFNLSTATSSYRLGPGDQIEVNVFGVPELTTSRVILADGTASLPIIGSVRLNGLSQEEAASELVDMYKPYNDKLQITVAVTNPRPMTISILGEVNRPGPYTLSSTQSATAVGATKQGTGEGTSGNTGGGRLTVSQALNLAGGVTSDADVEEITLIRKLPGGRNSRSKVNLWALLQNGDTAQDIPMLDGDALQIPRAQAGKANYDATVVANSTLSPSTVEVKVLGEVRQPGRVIVAPNALFSDALVAAGGLTNEADPKAVQLLRLNRDGTVSRYEIAAVLEQGRDPQKNPPLKKGDLITVPRSFGGGILSTLRELSPTFLLFNLLNIFR